MAYASPDKGVLHAGMSAGAVRFQCRQAGSGETPVILVHGDEANRLIAGHLPPHIPFYTFSHCRQEKISHRWLRIEDIAAMYLLKLADALPGGPVILCGYSIGGVIAFEMARQLEAQGHPLAALVLLDSRSPTLQSNREYHNRQFRWNESRVARLVRKAWKKAVVGVCLGLHLPVPKSQRAFFIMERYRKARRNYRPETRRGDAVLIRSTEHNFSDPALGWRPYVSGDLHIEEIRTDHHHITSEPAVAGVARILADIHASATLLSR